MATSPKGLGPENDCAGEDQQQFVNDRPVLSSERVPKPTNVQLSDNNKDLVVSPRWVLYSKRDWPTDRRS
jgi:hypothetical protein